MGFGDLGGGLDRSQVAADYQHPPVLAQLVQACAQAQRSRPRGHVEGVLADAGNAVVGGGAAERVEEGVVFEPVDALAVGDCDGPVVDVDVDYPRHS